ncbi:hypothetical protein L0N08_01220 [Enterocloster aldenensis]|uniref:Uncharacterized protein n=1 Tax=Enterocloster aldenensis TaxID=358742 RepID=A0AAW5BVH3_9FIRM|nr:hypothetical protein [Enterocloster aldenensis]
MIERKSEISLIKDREYLSAENNAYNALVAKGYTPQGADKGFKTVCVMQFEYPEYAENPAKRGKCKEYHFKNWQEALAQLS